MTPQEIRTAISESPELQALVPDSVALSAALSSGRTRYDSTTKFTSLGIAERFPALSGLPGPLAAEMVLRKLEGFAALAQQSEDAATKLLGHATARQMAHLTGAGMAIGSPAVAQMLAVIVAGGALTQAEADALRSVALEPAPVDEFEVRCAIFADDGTLRV